MLTDSDLLMRIFLVFTCVLVYPLSFAPQDSEEEDADDFKSADEQVTPQHSEGVAPPSTDFTEEVDIPPEVSPMVEPEPPTQYLHEVMPPGGVNHGVMGNPTAAEISQANNIMK